MPTNLLSAGTSLSPLPLGTPPPNEATWLHRWQAHTRNAPRVPQVPPQACGITTPLIPLTWRHLLQGYPLPAMTQFFLQGITAGFRLGFDYTQLDLKSAKRNLQSTYDHPEVVERYIHKEVLEHRVAGPFPPWLAPNMQVNRFGVIPKSHQPNKWRLIVDLSFPRGRSVNDSVPKDLCSMTYVTVDEAIQAILTLGPGTLLAKVDIQSAFRLIPVHPADRHLLAMKWNNSMFIDTCLPFGLRSAPKLFNVMADLLAWIVKDQGVSYVIHYLDDYLTIGAHSPECLRNLNIIIQTCRMLGVPLASEKIAGPAPVLEFLGILLDTHRMEARLPADKLTRTQQAITEWLGRKNATKREILSLVGLLQHAAKVVHPGRTFVSRMYSVAARVRELDYYTRLNRGFRSDLHWWHIFLHDWNGASFLQLTGSFTSDAYIQTDASGSWGCGGFLNGLWFQWQWPATWSPLAIMAKELVPIVIACAIWGHHLKHKVVLFQCDNMSVVAAVQKGSSKETFVMHLLRCLWFFTAYYDIALHIEHIAGTQNNTADQLSRYNMQSFFHSNPQASLFPTPLPQELLAIVGTTEPDWTSQAFKQLFSSTIAMVSHPRLRNLTRPATNAIYPFAT